MTPNNSAQAAMHDELRARLLRSAGELRGDNAQELIGLLREAAAALTLPASEAVAWLHKNGYSLLLDSGMHHATNPEDWTPLYTTPQPSPAAHAGGEADALRDRLIRCRPAVKQMQALAARNVGAFPAHYAEALIDEQKAWDEMLDFIDALLSGGAAREGK